MINVVVFFVRHGLLIGNKGIAQYVLTTRDADNPCLAAKATSQSGHSVRKVAGVVT